MSCPEPSDRSERVDAFHNGAFHLIQPVRSGFRAGLDALLLAAFVSSDDRGEAADLGAGTGAVGLSAAWRAPNLRVRLIERDADVAERLSRSLALPENAALAQRLSVSVVDLLGGRESREAAGLADASLDLVLTNPPFHPFTHRASPDMTRRAAMAEGGPKALEAWLIVACALLRHSGRLLTVLRPEALAALLAVAPNRLGAIHVLPVHTRPGDAAKRLIVSAQRGSRAPLRILPGLWLCDAEGRASAAADAIAAGSFDGAKHLR